MRKILIVGLAFLAILNTRAQQNVGIGTNDPKSKLDIKGGITVGNTYSGVDAAPANGAIIEGPVGIGTNAPDGKAVLDISSTLKGVFLPRLDNAQAVALGNTLNAAHKGLMIFNTANNRTEFWDGAAWAAVGAGAGGPPTGAASGDLSGTYPGPSIATGAVTGSKILDGSISAADMGIASVDLSGNVVTNLLPVNRGGTNSNAAPTGGSIAYGNGNSYAFNAPGSTNQVLVSGGTGTPTWNTVATLLGSAGGDLSGAYPDPTVAKLNGATAPTIGSANQILGVNNGATGLEYKTVNGTANQINITNGANAITLSAPQDIHSGASPTFNTIAASSLTASAAVYTDVSKNLTSAAPNNGTIGFWARDNANGYLYNTTLADKVGIGMNTPVAKLDINGTIATNRNYIYLAAGGDANHAITNISATDGEQFRFYNFLDLFQTNAGVGNASRLYINGSGNVGIGTNSWGASGARLAVHYSSAADQVMTIRNTSATGLSSIRLEDETGAYMGDIGYYNTDDVIRIGGNSVINKYFDGKVGIGTKAPDKTLHVKSASTDPVQIKIGNVGQDNNEWGIGREGQTTGRLGFYEYTTPSALTEHVTILGGGNVGIGNNNPGNKLVIDGTAPVEEIRSGGYLMMRPVSNTWDMRLQATTGVAHRLDVYSGGDLVNPITSFVSGGSVGVGTTTPDSKLDVNGELDFNTVRKEFVFQDDRAGFTYLANTWYTVGPAQAIGAVADGGHYIVGVSVQYNNPVDYHTMIGTGVIGLSWWKNAGTPIGTFIPLDAHNAPDVYCYVRASVGQAARNMEIMFLSDVTIDNNGGKVRIMLKRIF